MEDFFFRFKSRNKILDFADGTVLEVRICLKTLHSLVFKRYVGEVPIRN